MKHLFEHGGVLLDVEYDMEDGEPVFQSIYALGDDYKPTGPDLTGMLMGSYVLAKFDPANAQHEAMPFLSAICEELR